MTSTVTFHVGDVRDVMAHMAPHTIDLVVTSPPFLALRSYLPADHPDKHREIGSEATPAAFLDTLLGLSADWRRLLATHGSIAVEFGDTYSGAGGYGSPDSPNPAYDVERFEERWNGRTAKRFKRKDDGWPPSKSLCLIPTLYPACLAYGANLLNPTEPSPAGEWRIRNLLTWTRPNPPVGALGDKFRPATSFVTVACVGARRWFDLDAVRSAHAPNLTPRAGAKEIANPDRGTNTQGTGDNPAGAPPLDWWDTNDLTCDHCGATHADNTRGIGCDYCLTADWQPLHRLPTAPYPGQHFATFPVALPERLIRAMCPAEVCDQCGTPRTRITGDATYVDSATGRVHAGITWTSGVADGAGAHTHKQDGSKIRTAPTLGWSTCDCTTPTHRPGIVLDPFGGSGTTAVAAALAGRDAVLIDIDDRNLDLARQRLTQRLRIVTEHRDGDTVTFTVEAPLPHQQQQTEGQTSMFDLLEVTP